MIFFSFFHQGCLLSALQFVWRVPSPYMELDLCRMLLTDLHSPCVQCNVTFTMLNFSERTRTWGPHVCTSKHTRLRPPELCPTVCSTAISNHHDIFINWAQFWRKVTRPWNVLLVAAVQDIHCTPCGEVCFSKAVLNWNLLSHGLHSLRERPQEACPSFVSCAPTPLHLWDRVTQAQGQHTSRLSLILDWLFVVWK